MIETREHVGDFKSGEVPCWRAARLHGLLTTAVQVRSCKLDAQFLQTRRQRFNLLLLTLL